MERKIKRELNLDNYEKRIGVFKDNRLLGLTENGTVCEIVSYKNGDDKALEYITPRVRIFREVDSWGDKGLKYSAFDKRYYKGDEFDELFKNQIHDYKLESLTDDEIVGALREVFYTKQPRLHSSTCLGWTSDKEEDNPNSMRGEYILNDENAYYVEKQYDKIKYYRSKERDSLIREEKVDFSIYLNSLKMYNIKSYISRNSNLSLMNGTLLDKVVEYNRLKELVESQIQEEVND